MTLCHDGALFAINFENLTQQNPNLQMSFTVLLATYIGGVSFFLAPVFGAILFTILQTVIGLQKDFKSHKPRMIIMLNEKAFVQSRRGTTFVYSSEPFLS